MTALSRQSSSSKIEWENLSLRMPGYINCEAKILGFFKKHAILEKQFSEFFVKIEAYKIRRTQSGNQSRFWYETVKLSPDLQNVQIFKYNEMFDRKETFFHSIARRINLQLQEQAFAPALKISVIKFKIYDSEKEPSIMAEDRWHVKSD